MFNIDIVSHDVSIVNVEKEDIFKIEKWINNQRVLNIAAKKNYGIVEFYERYLEYYVSEGEYFLKVLFGSELIGIIKGRIEFKNPNEVWIMCYLLEYELYSTDIATSIINKFLTHLYENYGMRNFYTFVSVNNKEMLELWENNDFEISRVTNNFLEVDGKDKDILILKKTIR
ncbi:GNAT family N-acetyltransferase [Clostridium sp.]|uniref:GNAT family N-acetyltransferase n=1 Tax=Clostridium sp. TaxID=1506 RepID=UPI001A62F244|nr:GNAT family N-acetyltransferase [Clostridium sp.]MBK5241599.1 GNAT family N-acetyltransferase [Clostridium sp.]